MLGSTSEKHFIPSPSTHIFVFHVLEQPQFPVGSLGVDDGLEWPGELLHSHTQTSFCVKGRTATESNQINKINFL